MKVQTGEFSSYTNNLIDEHNKSMVWVWDCGPEEPTMPEEPAMPIGAGTDPKYNLEMLRYRRALKRYEDALNAYDVAEREFKHWHTNIRGPVELLMWSVDARDARFYDAKAVEENRQKKLRYFVSSRTRGYEKSKNLGLPPGVLPGPGHQEQLERLLAGEKEFADVLRKDPQFGDRP